MNEPMNFIRCLYTASFVLTITPRCTPNSFGQCFSWSRDFGSPGAQFFDILGFINAMRYSRDTGSLYVGGTFTSINEVSASGVAIWDGVVWAALGNGTLGNVGALELFGGHLIAGGSFRAMDGQPCNGIARWDGARWSRLGTGVSIGGGLNAFVSALTVYDDGNGPALIAAGQFTSVDGLPAKNIAKWDGTSWNSLDSDNPWLFASSGYIHALAVGQYRGQTVLFAGGDVQRPGQPTVPLIAAWNGNGWMPLQDVPNPNVSALLYWDSLYVGSHSMVSRFDGNEWLTLGQLIDEEVYSLAVFEDAAGPRLYAGGSFEMVDGTPISHIARWNGTDWEPLASGVGGTKSNVTYAVHALASNDDLVDPTLFVGGHFNLAGGNVSKSIAKWSGPGLPPLITDHPDDFEGLTDHPATFSVEAESVTSFQWRRDGIDLMDGGHISGSNTTTLLIDPVTLSDAGEYDCVVSNSCGFVVSDCAVLTVICYGDINKNNAIDVTDLLLVINLWGPCVGPPNICSYADIAPLGGDGFVNVLDLLAVINAWGSCF